MAKPVQLQLDLFANDQLDQSTPLTVCAVVVQLDTYRACRTHLVPQLADVYASIHDSVSHVTRSVHLGCTAATDPLAT